MTSSNLHAQFQGKRGELSGRVILVTGAGDGIGRCAAMTYAALGATVILLGKTASKLKHVSDKIIQLGGNAPTIIPLDHATAGKREYQGVAAAIASDFSRLDGALLNAGILGSLAPFIQVNEAEFDSVMQINVKSQLLLSQALLPLMFTTPHASLIFTSSGVGRQGRALWGSYAISKFAIEGMMQTIADEYKQTSLRVNCINPGATRTRMRAKASPNEDPNILRTPEQIMPTYIFLMSNTSNGTSGQSLDAQPKR